MQRRILLPLCTLVGSIAFAQSKPSSEAIKQADSVPFVGCEADGQMGPMKAPDGRSIHVVISADAATQLAYYKSAQGSGVLAPRGWHCFGVYGSNGSAIFVRPERLTAGEILSTKWEGLTGLAIEVAESIGDTSGRFSVARVIARVFPARRAFAEHVIAEGIESRDSFPFGPYPTDKLIYRSKMMVEYETPANADGLGTESWLRKNGQPSSGVAILVGETPDLVHLTVRLSPEASGLASAVIQQLEHDAKQSDR